MKNYQDFASKLIEEEKLSKDPRSRLSDVTSALLFNKNYVVDVHTHFFDILCINKSYFIIRMLKDTFKIRRRGETPISESEIEHIYKHINEYEENWEDKLAEELSFEHENAQERGLRDSFKALAFLKMKKMATVYNHYIQNFSPAILFDLPKEQVITTALMMDLEMGWNTKIKKTIHDQILELKELSLKHPVLPFLFCDPRRANFKDDKKNIYALFNLAFCEAHPFFGIKIYPALGYDPSDYRLWPIYALCEKYSIPVLSHCGGNTVSTDQLSLDIFEGDQKKTISGENRKEIAYQLNDPERWRLVLQKYPNLKLNLAHFGGYKTWDSSGTVDIEIDPQQRKETIFDLMNTYRNVYADFSFNIVDEKISKNLIEKLASSEEISNRALYGTDYWVVNKEGNLLEEQQKFIQLMDAKSPLLKQKLIKDNPNRYLFESTSI